MARKLSLLFGIVAIIAVGASQVFTLNPAPDGDWNGNTKVTDVLATFGDPYPDHHSSKMSPELIEQGKSLFYTGTYTDANGNKSRRQSRYFVCTNCHNMDKEDPDLRFSDPDKRLAYSQENKLAILQGTTMYGTVNKVSWYNGDYYKKYGDLVKPANSSLKEAVQLCATVCSQGRYFTDSELDAVFAYLWSLELKMSDLALQNSDWDKLISARENGGSNPQMVDWIKSFYLSGSPATFLESPHNNVEGYENTEAGNPENGRLIYDMSCLSCHDRQGPSKYLKLDHGKMSLNFLRTKIKTKGKLSLYEIVRHGTYADKGHRAYMPHFTGERMSNQQLEDLRAYVEQ